MEASHGAVVLAGLVIGLRLQGRPSEPEVDRPCSCHCACVLFHTANGDPHWLWIGVFDYCVAARRQAGPRVLLACGASFKKDESGAQRERGQAREGLVRGWKGVADT